MPKERAHTRPSVPTIGVLDAGGQYCHLIARKIRELGVEAEIKPSSSSAKDLQHYDGIIISGGPASVYSDKRPYVDRSIFDLGKPILGICYGHQVMAEALGGNVRKGDHGEYGTARLSVKTKNTIFGGLHKSQRVWMSHRDVVSKVPKGFEVIGTTQNCPIAAMANFKKQFYGLQFHPEVIHTTYGQHMLRNFVKRVCQCKVGTNRAEDRIARIVNNIKEQVGERRNVFFLVSGGVDSTVAFALCVMALGKERVRGLYVDTGFMRKYDTEDIEKFIASGMDNISVIDASQDFLSMLGRTWHPEHKRRKIGKKFLEITDYVLQHELKLSKDTWILGQGTIYPDTIESGSTKHASRIKTHHNRIELIRKLIEEGKVVEPLQEFYKDEVREIGQSIAHKTGLPEGMIFRHPFPGPGLAIRCLASPRTLVMHEHAQMKQIAGEFGLSSGALGLRSVGVKGDERSYDNVGVVAGTIPYEELGLVSTAITNKSVDINRVTYCLTEKTLSVEDWIIKRAFLSPERVKLLREADDIVMKFMEEKDLVLDVWQFPVILIPLAKKNKRGETIVLRPVNSVDGMTAEISRLKEDLLRELADRIMRLDGIDAVLLDITNKPPATIEWE